MSLTGEIWNTGWDSQKVCSFFFLIIIIISFSELWDFFLLAIRVFQQRKLVLRCNDEFNIPACLGTTLWWVLIPEALSDWFSVLGALDANSCKTEYKKRIIPHPAPHSALLLHSHQLSDGCAEGVFHTDAWDGYK